MVLDFLSLLYKNYNEFHIKKENVLYLKSSDFNINVVKYKILYINRILLLLEFLMKIYIAFIEAYLNLVRNPSC